MADKEVLLSNAYCLALCTIFSGTYTVSLLSDSFIMEIIRHAVVYVKLYFKILPLINTLRPIMINLILINLLDIKLNMSYKYIHNSYL